MKANIALLALPLSSVHLHLVVDPVMACRVHLIRVGAVLGRTGIRPQIAKHMTPLTLLASICASIFRHFFVTYFQDILDFMVAESSIAWQNGHST